MDSIIEATEASCFQLTDAICDSLRQRANAQNVSFQVSLQWPIHIINPVDKTKLSCNTPHRRNNTVSLETYPIYAFVYAINFF